MGILLGLLAFTPAALAQPSSPHIGYVYPAGGRQGAVFQVAVGGQYLNNATNAYICGPGVQSVVVDYSRPLTQKEFNDLREKLKELQESEQPPTAGGGRTSRLAVGHECSVDDRGREDVRGNAPEATPACPQEKRESGDWGNGHGPGHPGARRRAWRTGVEAGDADRAVQSAPFLRRPIGGIQQTGFET